MKQLVFAAAAVALSFSVTSTEAAVIADVSTTGSFEFPIITGDEFDSGAALVGSASGQYFYDPTVARDYSIDYTFTLTPGDAVFGSTPVVIPEHTISGTIHLGFLTPTDFFTLPIGSSGTFGIAGILGGLYYNLAGSGTSGTWNYDLSLTPTAADDLWVAFGFPQVDETAGTYSLTAQLTAPVPLPATLPLLAAGMGGFAFFARRRKAA